MQDSNLFDSLMEELNSKARFAELLSPWINFIIPALLSFILNYGCLLFVKSASNLELILFTIGIGTSVGIIINLILHGIFCIWTESCRHYRTSNILDPNSNICMSIIYGMGNLLGFYFWSGAYLAIVNGGSSGAIGGIICASGSMLIRNH
jgi:hypothetical protein